MLTQTPAVLFAEIPGRRPIGSAAAVSVASNGWEMVSVSGVPQAREALHSINNIRAIVTNEPSQELFETAREVSKQIVTILVTDMPIQEYCAALGQKDLFLLDHIIANFDAEWSAADLAITLQKIIRKDLFGIEKYLRPGTNIHNRIIKGSASRDPTNKEIQEWVESCGLGKNIGRLAYGISEELLMNAIYDAPIAGGRSQYETMDRHTPRELAPGDWSAMKFGVDDRLFAISMTDPFGAFLRDQWFTYLRKALKRGDSESLIDTKKGGAGLGLFKMLYSSHGVVCNVRPGNATEVIVLISHQHPIRDFIHTPRSIHYFNATES